MRKFLIVSLTVLVCLSLTSMTQAKVAVVATFVDEDNSSSLHVFDVDNTSNIFEMYSTTPLAGHEFRSLAVGTFVDDPLYTSQVVIATQDMVGDKAFARSYKLSPTAGTWSFDTGATFEYGAVDIASGQFDDDALDEYAMAVDTRSTKWDEYGGRLRIGNGDGWEHETNYIPGRYITGVAVGQYDDDPYDEIVVSTYAEVDTANTTGLGSDNFTGQLAVWDHMGGYSQAHPIHKSEKRFQEVFTDVATGDYTLDGKSETYVSTDVRPFRTELPYPEGAKVYSQEYRYNQPPDNGTWEYFAKLIKPDSESSYPADEALLKVATLNIDDDPECENVNINQQDDYMPGPVRYQESEVRVQDDRDNGTGEGMSLNNTDSSSGKIMDVITLMTSIDTGDLNGDGYDDIVVGLVSQGDLKFDPDPNLLETGIWVFIWDPATQYFVYKYGTGSDMTLNGRITDVKIVDLVPEPVSILLLLSGAFLAIRRRK